MQGDRRPFQEREQRMGRPVGRCSLLFPRTEMSQSGWNRGEHSIGSERRGSRAGGHGGVRSKA